MKNSSNSPAIPSSGDYPARVEIYTWRTCPYCIVAKLLLWLKGARYLEYKIDGDNKARQKMAIRADGANTVPQIFINDQHIGGCDRLFQLQITGRLSPLLKKSSA